MQLKEAPAGTPRGPRPDGGSKRSRTQSASGMFGCKPVTINKWVSLDPTAAPLTLAIHHYQHYTNSCLLWRLVMSFIFMSAHVSGKNIILHWLEDMTMCTASIQHYTSMHMDQNDSDVSRGLWMTCCGIIKNNNSVNMFTKHKMTCMSDHHWSLNGILFICLPYFSTWFIEGIM